jgi:hypothetical protein
MKRQITIIGVWGNTSLIYPNPHQLIPSNLSAKDRESIAVYIEKCSEQSFLSVGRGYGEECILSSDMAFIFFLKTDGRWLFPSSLAHYVREGVLLPRAFIEDALTNRLGTVAEPVSEENCFINESYWMYWALVHSYWNIYYFRFINRLVFNLPFYLCGHFIRRFFRIPVW